MVKSDLHNPEVSDNDVMPKHVAIIMDGNGRWAQQKGKLRTFGHKAGVDAVRASVRYARTNGIQSLTLFAFSSENWNRPEEEVGVLMDLFSLVLNSEVKRMKKNGVRLKVIGDTSKFDDKLVAKIEKAEALTAENSDLVLNIAANYGGRWDIVNACKSIVADVSDKTISPHEITEELFSKHVSTEGLPELDLLIRTGGEHRISNFLLWQCAYAELYFSQTLWPDFDEAEFDKATACFTSRQRRFGLTGEQVTNESQD
ncbi:di-trans,poly-cis-decaprenylcistransferase [Alteromonas sp. 5E99-2]|uniref:polyprenyl diphosphate synthase n=1 Tax=Alteromonas sp. 5E99-2 TaxID=2817683 RepID=UPI001A99A339|nr:polyprenyl diphosphate synthase [Alteromonas sp. 5E99-2]MBO1254099.1 di-trans,poly-cis-decaprenylcistransferase [Alteromonas sp. 5E99-2]